jgi:hypothetical protein
MHPTTTSPQFGLVRCPDCAPDGCEEHGDDCPGAGPWPVELWTIWDAKDVYPACPCCGRLAELVAPLVPLLT